MARDSQGNDLQAVDVQLTGLAAVKFGATSAPSLADIVSGTLPTGYEYIGLFLEDGGYAEEVEAGDQTNFFQQGYSISTGDPTIKGTLTPAEDNDTVWKLCGIDTDTWVRSDAAYGDNFGLIISTKMKNGNIVTRGGIAHVIEVSPSGEERGKINSVDLKFEWVYQTEFDGFYRVIRNGENVTQVELPEPTLNGNATANTATPVVYTIPDTADVWSNITFNVPDDVKAGDTVTVAFDIRKNGTTVGYVHSYWYEKDENFGSGYFVRHDAVSLKPDYVETWWQRVSGTVTVQAEQTRKLVFNIGRTQGATESTTKNYYVRNVEVWKIEA